MRHSSAFLLFRGVFDVGNIPAPEDLPVLVDLAIALNVRTDDLIFENPGTTVGAAIEEIAAILESCDAREANVITNVMRAMKRAVEKWRE